MKEIAIPLTKTMSHQVQNGEMKIRKITHLIGGEPKEAYELEYHNHIYKGSPFKVPTQFSTDFSIERIMRSSEVLMFLGRFE